MAEGLPDFTLKKIQTEDGIVELNRVLRFLFDNVAGDGQTVRVLNGFGSPENVVVADIGALYMRRDGSATTSLYVKTSGTGASGWTAK